MVKYSNDFFHKHRPLANIGLAIGLLTVVLSSFFYTAQQAKITWLFMAMGFSIIFLSLVIYLPTTKIWLFSRKGRRYLSSSVSMGLLFLILLAIYLGLYFELFFIQRDFSKNKIFSLSPQTLRVLKKINFPVEVMVFDSRDNNNPTHQMLTVYDQSSEHLTVNYVDAHKDPLLAKKYRVTERGSYVFINEKKSPVILKNSDFIQRVYDKGGEKLELRHEEKITSVLSAFMESNKSHCFFLTGHGERKIDDVSGNGLSQIKETLAAENITVKSHDLMDKQSPLPRAGVLVIAGAKTKFNQNEMTMLDNFLMRRGSLLILLDPILDSRGVDVGLNEMLAKYGFLIHNDVVIDRVNFFQLRKNSSRQMESSPFLPILTYDKHPIIDELKAKRLNTVFFSTRSLEKKNGFGDEFQYFSLLKTFPTAYGEVNLKQFDTSPQFEKGKDRLGPLMVGAVIEFPAEKTNLRRLAVFGDSGFIANHVVSIGGHKDLFINTVRWLLNEEKKITIRPKTITHSEVLIPLRQKQAALAYFLLLQPGGILIGGLFLVHRRKRSR